ncbi:MAG: DinB family protein [Synergistaceae bacterium]|nr:DinB family protein [Synergistaceae bacterium]
MMMQDVVKELRKNYERGFGFLFQQIEEAPDEAWKAQAGKWYYWQHLYHAFVCIDFFILPAGGSVDLGPGSLDVAMFKESPKEVLSKDAVREFGKAKKAQADAWLDKLADEDLAQKHEGSSSRRNMDVTNGMVLSNMIAHNFYHVGCNDTVLRENGHLGVY